MRRTKIVATIGPATDNPTVLENVLKAGVDVVRVNFSHGDPEDHKMRVKMVREIAAKLGQYVGILGDLQGPKIRTERFKDGSVQLEQGASFTLDASLDRDVGDQNAVGVTYKTLPEEVVAGNVLILDDGRIVLEVIEVVGSKIITKVIVGGPLSNNKGINLRGGGLSADAITDKDRRDILLAAELDVDYLAVSFPRSAEDMKYAKSLALDAGCSAGLVAKIERAEALEDIDNIINASDAIMVARGDLGVEIGDPQLPEVQKMLIARARTLNKIVITATQMMESMRESPIPTRAEVFDVANAVMDGTDAVMLSAETASGEYPARAVESMSRICLQAERTDKVTHSKHRIHEDFTEIDESVALASVYVANHLHVKAIGALTESGSTTLWMSRISSGIPICAVTRHDKTLRRVTLYRGVYPVFYEKMLSNSLKANRAVVNILRLNVIVVSGVTMIITKGVMMGFGG